MLHPLYLVQRLRYSSLDSDGFYSFTYKLKERVHKTRSFNLSLVICPSFFANDQCSMPHAQ
jgi:hypothetical protein